MDQVRELTNCLPGRYWAYGAGVDLDASFRDTDGHLINRRRQFGNMVLARWPLLMSRNHLLPKLHLGNALSLQRSALETIVDIPGGPCRIVSVHLAHASDTELETQIARLREIANTVIFDGGAWSGVDLPEPWTLDGGPAPEPQELILMGDFNMTPESEGYRTICPGGVPGATNSGGDGGLVDGWLAGGGHPEDGATCVDEGVPVRIDYIFFNERLENSVKQVWVDSEAAGSDHQPLWAAIDL